MLSFLVFYFAENVCALFDHYGIRMLRMRLIAGGAILRIGGIMCWVDRVDLLGYVANAQVT